MSRWGHMVEKESGNKATIQSLVDHSEGDVWGPKQVCAVFQWHFLDCSRRI